MEPRAQGDKLQSTDSNRRIQAEEKCLSWGGGVAEVGETARAGVLTEVRGGPDQIS